MFELIGSDEDGNPIYKLLDCKNEQEVIEHAESQRIYIGEINPVVEEDKPLPHRQAKSTHKDLRFAAIESFLFGILCFCFFFFVNLASDGREVLFTLPIILFSLTMIVSAAIMYSGAYIVNAILSLNTSEH